MTRLAALLDSLATLLCVAGIAAVLYWQLLPFAGQAALWRAW